MELLYSDADLVVCVKPKDTVSEHTDARDGLADLLVAELGGEIFPIHRLDRGVGGVSVFARSAPAAASLSRQLQAHELKKEYLAVAHGRPESRGEWRDLLFFDRRQNKTFVVDRVRAGAKEAILQYEILRSGEISACGICSLVRVRLQTGRTHQIRVQFASRGYPLLGDRKYGAKDRRPIALFSHRLIFCHPRTGETMDFSAPPPADVLPMAEETEL